MRLISVALVIFAWVASSSLAEENWSRFRGPNGSGITEAENVPSSFTKDNYRWRTTLPGGGHSSPVAWEDTIFVTYDDSTARKRFLAAFHADTGEKIWAAPIEYGKHPKHKQNTYASTTPAADENNVYVLWQQKSGSHLLAFSHAGEKQWSVDLGSFVSGHGSATSPIVFEGKVIVCNDNQGPESYLLAVNAKDGSIAWKTPRKVKRTCYSTPCIFHLKERGAEIIFTHSYLGISGVDPNNGQTNWNIKPFGEFKQRACASPIISGDLVLGASGFASAEKNVVAVRITGKGSATQAIEAYRITSGAPHVPTPIVHGELVYCWTDQGIVTAADLKTGKTIWKKRIGGNFFASPICIAGRLFNISRDGEIVVLKTGDKFEEIARNDIGEGTSASLAIANGRLIIRTENSLIAIDSESR